MLLCDFQGAQTNVCLPQTENGQTKDIIYSGPVGETVSLIVFTDSNMGGVGT